MKLSEAIEILEINTISGIPIGVSAHLDAERQGVEAMKGIVAWRVDHDDDLLISLPGETEE